MKKASPPSVVARDLRPGTNSGQKRAKTKAPGGSGERGSVSTKSALPNLSSSGKPVSESSFVDKFGPLDTISAEKWVCEDIFSDLQYCKVEFVPSVYNVFSYLLKSALNSVVLHDGNKISIDITEDTISVRNNGNGNPLQLKIDSESGKLVPRDNIMIKFIEFLSDELIIETSNGKFHKTYKKTFHRGKKDKWTTKEITCASHNESWTKIQWKPDSSKLKIPYDNSTASLMRKRVVDVTGTIGYNVQVKLNGEELAAKLFEHYVDMYTGGSVRCFDKIDQWETTFVNGYETIASNAQVENFANQIAEHLVAFVQKRKCKANIGTQTVKQYLWVFVNARIDDPKSHPICTTLSNRFFKEVENSPIADILLKLADSKEIQELKETFGLVDALCAGGIESNDCTLILTEGESAKALAVDGLTITGCNYYGVYALCGKILNVKDSSPVKISKNTEVNNIKEILNLQDGKDYKTTDDLRYGHIMIMTDQDNDGFHIKGLIINLFHTLWPSLLHIPGFLSALITPIVKATHLHDSSIISFYNMLEYKKWKARESLSDWSIKYYKGLGTSKREDGKEYFKNMKDNRKYFVWVDHEDGDAIERAFGSKFIKDRRRWVENFEETFLDYSEMNIRFLDFFNKEFIHYSIEALNRSIPSMVDGLKISHRKILFCSLKRNLDKEIKVAQLAGYVSEHSRYHHGEQSLEKAIVGMAQTFVGRNNVNILHPNGHFGTREQGAGYSAHPRYIETKLSPITHSIFKKDDENQLCYKDADGYSVEPDWYIPVIPMVLVNGADGIAPGWSTFVPSFNPKDITHNIRRMLNGDEPTTMIPWFRGFKGKVSAVPQVAGMKYLIDGCVEIIGKDTVKITELPPGVWTVKYKQCLDKLLHKTGLIKDYKIHNGVDSIDIEVTMEGTDWRAYNEQELKVKLSLSSAIVTSNMYLFNKSGDLKKYNTVEEIMKEFFWLRLDFYKKRKDALLGYAEAELVVVKNKLMFIAAVNSGEIKFLSRSKLDLCEELLGKFDPLLKNKEPEQVIATAMAQYHYLLALNVLDFSKENQELLVKKKTNLENQLEELRNATAESLWLADLDVIDERIDVLYGIDAEGQKASEITGRNDSMRSDEVERKGDPRKTATKSSEPLATVFCSDDEDDFTDEQVVEVTTIVAPDQWRPRLLRKDTTADKKAHLISPRSMKSVDGKVYSDYRIIRKKADGTCFYRALVHGLRSDSGSTQVDQEAEELQDALSLRGMIADAYLTNRKIAEENDLTEGDYDAYVHSIRHGTIWGGEPEAFMASIMLKAPIFIYKEVAGGVKIFREYGRTLDRRPITIFYNGKDHYDAIEIQIDQV